MVSKEHSNQDGYINAYRNPTQDVLYANASRVFYLSLHRATGQRDGDSIALPA